MEYDFERGKFTKSQVQSMKNSLVNQKFAYDFIGLVAGGVQFWIAPVAMIGSSKFQALVDKYTVAISRMTTSKKYIRIYDIRTWKNRGQNSGYVTTSQRLDNVS